MMGEEKKYFIMKDGQGVVYGAGVQVGIRAVIRCADHIVAGAKFYIEYIDEGRYFDEKRKMGLRGYKMITSEFDLAAYEEVE